MIYDISSEHAQAKILRFWELSDQIRCCSIISNIQVHAAATHKFQYY